MKNNNFSQTGPRPWLILDQGDLPVVIAGGSQIMMEFLDQWRGLVSTARSYPFSIYPRTRDVLSSPFSFSFFKGFLINFLFQWWDNEF